MLPRSIAVLLAIVACQSPALTADSESPKSHVRVNLVGYLPADTKVAVVFSHERVEDGFAVVHSETGASVYEGKLASSPAPGWGKFEHYYVADFSKVTAEGNYELRLDSGARSTSFRIGDDAYGNHQADLLLFMRQQRCGYNPYLDMACHRLDGRTAYGPRPAESFIDASGGWHDAGDQLKYLITSSFATAAMLLAYELEPDKFGDIVDDMGRPRANGIADVLDEAKWGLDWMLKLHPTPDELYHQVADDRDHNGWKWPNDDSSDYGWGPNSYRVAYAADGKPQGLAKYQSKSTGMANLAGRYAAAMTMAARIWRTELGDHVYAARCLQAAKEVYSLGKRHEGFQQGNSYGAPYRYEEDTWADDMEWGAAELFKATGEVDYLDDAKRYAEIIGDTSWMPLEKAGHYQMYPFINIGHFALYPLVDKEFQGKLAGYYRSGIDATVARAEQNAFGIGVPFIWCSNNLATALATQVLLYEQMTGDRQHHDHLLAQRDWLLGRNPWGTSMFTGIPRDGERPIDVHTSLWKLGKMDVPGGLVDGPVYAEVYNSLKGLHLENPDEFAEFQNDFVVYHDDIGDYSTNEPTMDGTAGAVYLMAHFGTPDPTSPRRSARQKQLSMSEGGVVRGPRDEKRLAMVFTGGSYGEGAVTILDALENRGLRGSFFVTGDYLAMADQAPILRRMIDGGHYLGPHSHAHLLYAPWEDRSRSLVTEREFKEDLEANLAELRKLGACQTSPVYFIPPYEYYIDQHSKWSGEMGCVLFNFTPGSGSNRDWAPESHRSFRPSKQIAQEILDFEAREPDGLNGFLLLLHLGSDRKDKMPPHVGPLLDELIARGYAFARVDELLGSPQAATP
ncbi:glycoside hydrolase family 9 protein [Botrimarina mediterranea]|uniref:Endoglucanase D n=1 Tax=Botrimarina mediterranea TaxID=2528022 RepID=A0A518KDD7_9BACT|nr:glycoside hydrolase family 9 protein [Botrimarina mediterranea]QDV75811.1 Endoglucanase D precursor [Botrimarina mediterranea]